VLIDPQSAYSSLRVPLWPALAHRIAPHLDTMSVVDEPIKDSVRQRGITNLFMPPRNRQVAK
jgi:hypothetical protein